VLTGRISSRAQRASGLYKVERCAYNAMRPGFRIAAFADRSHAGRAQPSALSPRWTQIAFGSENGGSRTGGHRPQSHEITARRAVPRNIRHLQGERGRRHRRAKRAVEPTAKAAGMFLTFLTCLHVYLERIPVMFEHSRRGVGNSCILLD
jgi:hypothetical protein